MECYTLTHHEAVKAMLTGPVTILAWSFVRDDQALDVTARQVALALRDETADLEAAGISIIQVDEPALRELLPLRTRTGSAYLDWAVELVPARHRRRRRRHPVHTHLCYSEFGEVIGAIDDLDADVTTHRGGPLADGGAPRPAPRFRPRIGPGVYDIHSPRVPRTRRSPSSCGSRCGACRPTGCG